MTERSMNFMITINNPKECDEPPNVWSNVRYVIWQHEKGENGTDHIQAYVCFDKLMSFKQVHDIVPEGAWVQKRKGTHKQAKAYCSKADTRIDGPWEHGEEPSQGQRSDLDAAASLAVSQGMHAVSEQMPNLYVRYHRGLEALRTIRTPPRTWLTELIIYWGPPNTGKSWHCRDLWPDAYWLKKGRDGQEPWWDGYDGHKTVIIDEFKGWITPGFMCRLVDQFPLRVDIKGSSAQFVAERIVICSNYDPRTWWKDPKGMTRRLDAAYTYHITEQLYDSPPYPDEEEYVPASPKNAWTTELKRPQATLEDHQRMVPAMFPSGKKRKFDYLTQCWENATKEKYPY